MRKIFISYARANKQDVDQLAAHLSVLGYQPWVDSLLRGGQDWWDQILRRISECDVFITIVSQPTLNSSACGREFDWAEALGKPILPVAIEGMPGLLPRRLSSRQIVDYSRSASRDRAALVLAGSLAALPPPPKLPSPLPRPPGAPLSYLWDLIDLVSRPNVLTHREQLYVTRRLGPALRSKDSAEATGAREILEKFGQREDLALDVYQAIAELAPRRTTPVPRKTRPPRPPESRPPRPPERIAQRPLPPTANGTAPRMPREAPPAPVAAPSAATPPSMNLGANTGPVHQTGLSTRRKVIFGVGATALVLLVTLPIVLWPRDSKPTDAVRQTPATPITTTTTSTTSTTTSARPPVRSPQRVPPSVVPTNTQPTSTSSTTTTSSSSTSTPPSTVQKPPPTTQKTEIPG